jgi:hypothetical protein
LRDCRIEFYQSGINQPALLERIARIFHQDPDTGIRQTTGEVNPEINPACVVMTKDHVEEIAQPAETICGWVLWKMQTIVQGVWSSTSSVNGLESRQSGCWRSIAGTVWKSSRSSGKQPPRRSLSTSKKVKAKEVVSKNEIEKLMVNLRATNIVETR